MSVLALLEIEAKDGCFDEMVKVLAENLGDTRARPGCEWVTVHRDQAKPNTLLLVERWATREDDASYRAWRAGDGAIAEMVSLVASRSVRYFDDLDA